MTPKQVITADCKEYSEGAKRFTVSQIEELSFSHLAEKQPALLEARFAVRSAATLRGTGYHAKLLDRLDRHVIRTTAVDRFDVSRMVDQYVAVYADILDPRA